MTGLRAFQVDVDGKHLDYRVGHAMDLDKVSRFFGKKYRIGRIWNGGRHVLGTLFKNDTPLFLKLATTTGISVLTHNEYRWNELANRALPKNSPLSVPVNFEEGWFTGQQYYMVTELVSGIPFSSGPVPHALAPDFIPNIPRIIDCIDAIQNLPGPDGGDDFRKVFLDKVDAWFEAIPPRVRDQYRIGELVAMVREHAERLVSRPRHGDVAPWHLFRLDSGKIGLIDGEHYEPRGVALYDGAYLIQRLFAVLEEIEAANAVYGEILARKHDQKALLPVLSARAVGGYLDASLHQTPDYRMAASFHAWILSLK